MIFDRVRRLENRSERIEAGLQENTRVTREIISQTEAIAVKMHDLSLNGERQAIREIASHLPAIAKLAPMTEDIISTVGMIRSIRKAAWFLVATAVAALISAMGYWVVVINLAHH